jgi:hypothetical protein
MIRSFRLVAGLTVALAAFSQSSQAQYYYPAGYGGYGWGGWGAGSTVAGSTAMGMGVFAQGLGAYNLETAQAASINADTLGRWNEYLYESQQVRNMNYYKQLAATQQKVNSSRDAIFQRLRDNPTPSDINNGDALNVILDQLTEPKIYKTAVRSAKTHLSGTMIKDIPFQYASEAITTSLHELTSDADWPTVLRGEAFAKERQAYRDIIQKALDEDVKGELTPETIQAARDAIHELWVKVGKTLPKDSPQRFQAERYIKGLGGMTRMLESPVMDAILAGLEKYQGSTVGDLLTFMHAFNLRFGVANTERQRRIYRELYPVLDQQRDDILAQVGTANNATARAPMADRKGRPAEFFSGMDWEHLSPAQKKAARPGNNPPPPEPEDK